MKSRAEFQNVIVGSGPGGAVAADLLAAQGQETLIIEEGLDWNQLDSPDPFSFEEIRHKYRQRGMTVAMGKPSVAFGEGCCVGGGSEINSGLYHRCPDHILKKWRQDYQLECDSMETWKSIYRDIERELSVQQNPAGISGTAEKLRDGADALGWQGVEVPRWVSYRTDSDGTQIEERQTMSRTYLGRALKNGCQIRAGTKVDRIEYHRKAWFLHCRDVLSSQSQTYLIKANKCFLACGTIQSPYLLLRSGLLKHKSSPLHLHPTLKVVARFPESIKRKETDIPSYQVKEHSPEYSFGCAVSTLQHLALNLLDHPEILTGLTESGWQNHATYYAMTTGGRGRVLNPRIGEKPVVTYRLSQKDTFTLSKSVKDLMRLLLEAGAEQVAPTIRDSPVIRSQKEIADLPDVFVASQMSLMTLHLFSTLRMGEDSKSLVDSFGKVRGKPNLWVTDASLLPGPPSVNPQGCIMAFVKRNMLHQLNML